MTTHVGLRSRDPFTCVQPVLCCASDSPFKETLEKLVYFLKSSLFPLVFFWGNTSSYHETLTFLFYSSFFFESFYSTRLWTSNEVRHLFQTRKSRLVEPVWDNNVGEASVHGRELGRLSILKGEFIPHVNPIITFWTVACHLNGINLRPPSPRQGEPSVDCKENLSTQWGFKLRYCSLSYTSTVE